MLEIQLLDNSFSNQIVQLILPIQQEEFKVSVTLEDQPDLLDIEKYYHNTGGGFWGAIYNGELVGTIALIGIGNHAGAVRKMFVKEAYRGKELKIAQQLFDELINYCKTHEITDIYLGTVLQMKAAHRFYERNGFLQIEKATLPSSFPLMAPDNVFYHLTL